MEEGSGESGQEVWAQWNVIMGDDVILCVINYGFSDSSIASYYSVRSRGLTTMTIEVGLVYIASAGGRAVRRTS